MGSPADEIGKQRGVIGEVIAGVAAVEIGGQPRDSSHAGLLIQYAAGDVGAGFAHPGKLRRETGERRHKRQRHFDTGLKLDQLGHALEKARDQGKVRCTGLAVEKPWTARPFIASNRFDVIQVRYNLIYQSAALHVLNETRAADLGVAVMRPMTSGMLQRIAHYPAPQWPPEEIHAFALKFLLSDSRVHVANVGMHWPEEVAGNVVLASSFAPPFDMAELPRWTAGIYQTEDESAKG